MVMAFIFFVYGLVFGSFLNVCIYRLPLKQSIVWGRSHCTCCNKPIAAYDLIPVFSYLFLLGKCRGCKTKISPLYPLVELLTGFLFILCYLSFSDLASAILMCFVCCILIVIFFIDLKHYIIPDSLNFLLIILSVIHIAITGQSFTGALIGAVVVSLPIFIIAKITNGFGEGDAFLFLSCGLLLGWQQIILAAFVSVLTGGVAASVLLLAHKKGLKSQMPFGPFIVAGVWVALFFGEALLAWYLRW